MKSGAKLIIFSGPTLSKQDIENQIDAIVLGPVSQGDVLKAYKEHKPTHIGIIDGYYENVPSVWHKEILYVISQGVKVYGGASMGALRAAELQAFGMRGVGKIFEMFVEQDLEDDDEVAVLHGPAELGFPALTDAMVNIRLTLQKAKTENILSPIHAENGTHFMKSLFYKNRSRHLLMDYYFNQLRAEEFLKFQEWYENNFIDQKQLDAFKLIEILEHSINNVKDQQSVNYTFYKTSFFKKMFTEVDTRIGDA